jgi:hypothetical protein
MKQVGRQEAYARARILAVIVTSVTMLAATGCGGSGGGTSGSKPATTTAGPTHAAPSTSAASTTSSPLPARDPKTARFVSRAEAICKRTNVELKKANSKLAGEQGKAAITSIVKGVPRDAILELEALSRLRKLRVPASAAGSWNRVLGLRATIAKYTARLGPTVASENIGAIMQLQSHKKAAHEQLTKVAAPLSLTECGAAG